MGSDSKYNSAPGGYTDFNPRSRMGSDMKYLPELLKVQVFQSTLPHGERLDFSLFVFEVHTISIHAPAWGATNRNY